MQRPQNRSTRPDIRNEFTQLPPNHLLSDLDLLVRLPVVHGKAQAHKVGQDGSGALLGANWGCIRGRGDLAWERETKVSQVSILLLMALRLSLRSARGGFAIGVSRTGRCSGLIGGVSVDISVKLKHSDLDDVSCSYLSRPNGPAARVWETWCLVNVRSLDSRSSENP